MPLARLLEYLEHFKNLVPDADKLHLIGVEEGSTQPAFFVEPDYEETFRYEIVRASEGTGVDSQNKAFVQINYMADEDGFPAKIEGPNGKNIIQFPGARRPIDSDLIAVGGVKEHTTIFATPFKVGKKQASSTKYDIWLTDLKTGAAVPKARAPLEVGIQMGAHLERPLAVNGVVEMMRLHDGNWSIAAFEITGFKEFAPSPVSDTFEAINNIEFEWPSDLQQKLEKLRNNH